MTPICFLLLFLLNKYINNEHLYKKKSDIIDPLAVHHFHGCLVCVPGLSPYFGSVLSRSMVIYNCKLQLKVCARSNTPVKIKNTKNSL